MPENEWACGKCGRRFNTEGEAVACYNSHPKAVKTETITKKYPMRFKGGKGAPSQLNMIPLEIGKTYELPMRYAKFAWFEPVNKIPGYVAPPTTPAESVFPAAIPSGEVAEAEAEFRAEVSAELGDKGKFLGGPLQSTEKDVATEKKDEPKKLTRELLNKWNKKSLVNFIKAQGGEADENLLKAQLVDLAFELTSKNT